MLSSTSCGWGVFAVKPTLMLGLCQRIASVLTLFYISAATEPALFLRRIRSDQITLDVTLHYQWLPTALLENCQGVAKTQANRLIDKIRRNAAQEFPQWYCTERRFSCKGVMLCLTDYLISWQFLSEMRVGVPPLRSTLTAASKG